jgi:hypothetical protein
MHFDCEQDSEHTDPAAPEGTLQRLLMIRLLGTVDPLALEHKSGS